MKDCIWNSFLASEKRHLLVTGTRGAGKTTLLQALFGENTPKITTWAVPGEGVSMQVNPGHRASGIGVFDPNLPGPEQRMRPLAEGFPVEEVQALARCPGQWLVVDEVGYLDFACPAYLEALWELGKTKRLALAVRKEVADRLLLEDVFRVNLDDLTEGVGCVLLASGLGQRFGSNKLLAPFRGRPMVQQALEATGDFSRRVVVTRHREVQELCCRQGIAWVLHSLPHRSDTVRLGLEALEGVQACIFCPADQPLLTRQTLVSLALLAQNSRERIWRPRCAGVPGAPVAFPQWAFGELKALPQGKGGGVLLEKYPERVGYLPLSNPLELQDADTPEMLARLEKG